MRRISIPWLCVVMLALAPVEISAQKTGSARVVKSVRVVEDKGAPAVEILSSVPITPHVRALDSPPRLVIDFPNSRLGLTEKPAETGNENILALHVSQVRDNPPATRIVVDLLAPYGYALAGEGNRLLVRLRPPEDSDAGKPASQPASADFSLATDGAVVPLAGGTGSVVLTGGRVGSGSSVTSGVDTTILQLPRGGEVRICPGTTIAITLSKSKRDLMFGVSTGTIETHYALSASTDTVLTPDFRIMFAGPGEFHYAISADSHGNTCVRALKGNTSSAIVSELMGNRIHQVRPSEEAVFRAGQIDKVDSDVPLSCGCPPPSAVIRTQAPSIQPAPEQSNAHVGGGSNSSLPANAAPANVAPAIAAAPTSAAALSNGPETAALPASQPNDVHVQVDAPFVFNARDRAASISPAPVDATRELPVEDSPDRPVHLDAVVQSPSAKAKPEHRGIFGRVKGFFSAIFHD